MQRILLFLLAGLMATAWSCTGHQHSHTEDQQSDLPPLERLKAGNERFADFHPAHPDQSFKKLKELEEGQHPFAVIVSCSDSRVPPELVFDQGLGDLFVIRTAGNVMGDFELGSIEYAVEHLGAGLVVVLGHEECGAVKAFLESDEAHPLHGHIESIVEAIREEPEEQAAIEKEGKKTHPAVMANIQHGVNQIKNSEPTLGKLVKAGKLQVVGGVYNIENGKVRFLE